MFWVGEDTNVGLGDGLDGGGGSRHCDCRSMHDGRRERKRKSIEEDDKSELWSIQLPHRRRIGGVWDTKGDGPDGIVGAPVEEAAV